MQNIFAVETCICILGTPCSFFLLVVPQVLFRASISGWPVQFASELAVHFDDGLVCLSGLSNTGSGSKWAIQPGVLNMHTQQQLHDLHASMTLSQIKMGRGHCSVCTPRATMLAYMEGNFMLYTPKHCTSGWGALTSTRKGCKQRIAILYETFRSKATLVGQGHCMEMHEWVAHSKKLSKWIIFFFFFHLEGCIHHCKFGSTPVEHFTWKYLAMP